MIQLKDIKEAVAEIMNEFLDTGSTVDYDISATAVAAHDEEEAMKAQFRSLSSKASKKEMKILKTIANLAYHGKVGTKSFEEILQLVARHLRIPIEDFKIDPDDAASYICSVVALGADGYVIKLGPGKPEACPRHWGAKIKSLSPDDGGMGGKQPSSEEARAWRQRMPAEERKVWKEIGEIYDNMRTTRGVHFRTVLSQAARAAGVPESSLSYLTKDLGASEAMAKKMYLSESKKRGFGEGEPPPEEIYKKREIVQEAELETPDIAKELGDASKEQGEATMGVADAHTRGAEAAKQRQEASKAWKDAKITQIKAVDAAEKYADQEAKAIDAQSQAMEAAQKAADAGEAASAEKEKMLGVAKQAHEQEKEAASAAEEAAAAEEEAATELADTNTAASETGTERSELETEFGDAIASDEETKEDAAEEKEAESEKEDAEAEKEKKAEQDADADAKEEEREANDEKAADGAEAEEEATEEEPEEDESSAPEATFSESLMSMIRKEYKLLRERKWGDKKEAGASPQQKLQKAGLTADDLRSMVLNTVMQGEEDRDREMIKLLKDMLLSLQSIEYHTSPVKGAGAQHAQTAAGAWVSESKNRERVFRAAGTISEMRVVGMHIEADDHESFFRWIVDNPSLTLQEIKNEADAQISDIEAELRKLDDQYVEEDPFLKQKAEVPGHHN